MQDEQNDNKVIGTIIVKNNYPNPNQTMFGRFVTAGGPYKGLGAMLLEQAEAISSYISPDNDIILEVFNRAVPLIQYYMKKGYYPSINKESYQPEQRMLALQDQDRAIRVEDKGKLSFFHLIKKRKHPKL